MLGFFENLFGKKNNSKPKKRPSTQCVQCGRCPCVCMSWCPSRQLGCCNQENSSKQCAGPVHLTGQIDIGSRQCCNGAGKKYTALNGLLNYCSLNDGKEFPGGKPVLSSFGDSNYADILVPLNPNQYNKPQSCPKECYSPEGGNRGNGGDNNIAGIY